MITTTFKITLSPFSPNVESVGSMVFSSHPPYNDKTVTLVVNPSIEEYKDTANTHKEISLRQLIVTQDTNETRRMSFDIDSSPEQSFDFRGNKYKVKLLNIGKKNLEGQDFPFFEFFLEEVEE